jgi:hypothetical protein
MDMKTHALCVVAVVAFAGAAQAELVTNGGFETGDFTGWTQFGNTGFTGVSGVFGGVSPTGGSFQSFFGPVGSTGGITQTLTVGAGKTVVVSFNLYNFGGTPNSIVVDLGGTVLLSLTDAAPFAYTTFTYTTTTGAANPALTFDTQQNPSYWLLDDVSVSVVPMPTGAAMGLAGFAGVGILGRVARRRA